MNDHYREINYVEEQQRLTKLYSSSNLVHQDVGHVDVFSERCFGESDLEIRTDPGDYSLMNLVESQGWNYSDVTERILHATFRISGRSVAWNGRTVRLVRCQYRADKVILTVQHARYYDYLATNYAAFLQDHFPGEFPNLEMDSTFRTLLEPPPCLSSLESAKCANHVGISCVICTSDNTIALHRRANNITFPGSVNPLPSSVWEWDTLAEEQNPFAAIRRQLTRKEAFLEDVSTLVCLGITRELCRAGKPEMFFYLAVSASFEELQDRIVTGASEQRQLQEIVPIPLPRSGDREKSLAALKPWIFQMPDCAPTTQGALWLLGRAIRRGDLVFENGQWTSSSRSSS